MTGLIERTLLEVLPAEGSRPAVLAAAMRHAVLAGGKRLRPLVCLGAAVAVGGRPEDAKYPAAAVELLHNYTLVHDDLPAMDNDRLRRGQPTVWAKFGEANAILAGDALLALAFATAAKAPRRTAEIVAALGAAGVGVVRGQVEDVSGSSNRRIDEAKGEPADPFVYEHKTADLFVAAATTGALAGDAAPAAARALGEFALNLGLAFQHADDLLDGDSPYPAARTAELVRSRTAAAVAALEGLPGDASFLRKLAQDLADRKS